MYRRDGRGDACDNCPTTSNSDQANADAGEFGLAQVVSDEAWGAYGLFVADVDGDQRLDIFIPDMGYGSLLINRGKFFEDRVAVSKLAVICGQYTGWGGILFDYDNDGYLDVFVANGNAHARLRLAEPDIHRLPQTH